MQTPGEARDINTAMFQQNGGCGYVLRAHGADRPSMKFTIRILGAHNVPHGDYCVLVKVYGNGVEGTTEFRTGPCYSRIAH